MDGKRWGVVVLAAGLWSVGAGTATAQSLPPQTSTEQGQTTLEDSFESDDDRRDRIRAQRREGLDGIAFDVQLRTYMLDRNRYDDSEVFAWALGGSAGLKTGYFRDRMALGFTAYISQPVDAPDDKDGSGLLAPGQEGYQVLGESYLQFRITDGLNFNAGRKIYDTPYINRNDVRMTPNTFEAVALQGVMGSKETGEWRYGLGYFDQIKERTASEFIPMSQAAGAPDGVDRGVYSAGANYKLGGLSIGAIDYYSIDIINIFYTEAVYNFPLAENRELRVSAQYTDQQAVGDDLLTGADFSADQFGIKTDLTLGPTLLTLGYTTTGDGANMRNPWSGYPGYTGAQVEDFNRAGEDAWMLRASYRFPTVPGLSVYGLWVNGSDPDSPTDYERDEYDFNLQWSPESGALKGLMFRVRYALVEQSNGTDLYDFRLLVFYDPPSL